MASRNKALAWRGDVRALIGGDDAIIDFAGEQAERKADHAARMAEHTLDREMRLAGVGGTKDCR